MAQQSAHDESLLPLEAYLASPTLMHPTRICNFLKIVEQMDKQENDFKTFIDGLNERAIDQGILGNRGNWKLVMDSHDGTETRSAIAQDESYIRKYSHCYFLTTTYIKSKIRRGTITTYKPISKEQSVMKRLKERLEETVETSLKQIVNQELQKITTSIFELLKFMRNKYVHFKDYPPGIQTALGWGTEINETISLSDSLYINYWNLRFPKLFSFIWKEFYQLEEQFQQLCTYYPSELTMYMPEIDITLSGFVTNLKSKLQDHLKMKGLYGYYIFEDKKRSLRLEFRHLSSALQVAAPYEHSSEVYVRVSCEGVKTVFKKDKEITVSYNFPGDSKSLAIMVKLTGLGVESKFLRQCVDCEKIVVFLRNEKDMKNILSDIEKICKLEFRPVLWKDLDASEKSMLFNKLVQVHDKEYNFKSILPDQESLMEELLLSLDANELQNLFQYSVPKLFSKCIKPKVDKIYIGRRIFQTNNAFEVVQEHLEQGGRGVNEETWMVEEKNSKLMFLCDKPGQGKTTFTSSFANKTSNFLVLHLTAAKFSTEIKQNHVDKESLMDTFSKIFCFTPFEKRLFEAVLTENVRSKKVLILIDALDEIASESAIINALLIIRNHFPTVQVMVTMRVHLFYQTNRKITEATYFRLDSFSDEDKIQYLTQYWDNYIKGNRKKDTNTPLPTQKQQQQLTDFARKCTEIKIHKDFQDVLGVALQLKMLAEIYAENLLNGNFRIDINDFGNVTRYFEKLFHSKCEIYYREKYETSRVDLVETPMFKKRKGEMYTLHTYFALKFFLGDHICATLFKKTFLAPVDADTKTEVLNFGIIKTFEPLKFMHQLIAEYLMAFFYMEVANENGIYNSMFSQYMILYEQEYCRYLSKLINFLKVGNEGLLPHFNSYKFPEKMIDLDPTFKDLYKEVVIYKRILEQYSSGNMQHPKFHLNHPSVIQFLNCLSKEQSNSEVNLLDVFPIYDYFCEVNEIDGTGYLNMSAVSKANNWNPD